MFKRNNPYIKTTRSWTLIIFGAFCATPATILLFWSIIPSVSDSVQMQSWDATSATLESAKVTHHRGDETTTYKANARYRYTVNGTIYKNNRVQISSGSDNIGEFQRKFGNKLELDYLNRRPITIYYNTQNPADSIIHRGLRWELLLFKSIMVAVFGLAGFGIMIWGWRGQKVNTAPETHSQPWLVETDWMDNRIFSDSKSGLYFSAIFAAFWNLISLPLAIFIFPDAYQKEGLMVALIVLLFPAVGLGLLFWVYRNFREWRKFGRTPLQLSPFPGVIGGDVGGKISFKQRLPDAQDYPVTLSLVNAYNTGSGKNRRTEEDLIWQKEGIAKLKQVLKVDTNSELHFRFKVPTGLPESDAGLSSNRHIWRVSVENKALGLSRSFEIPVYAVAEQDSSKTSQQRYGRIEYSSISDDPQTSSGSGKKSKRETDIRKYLPFVDKLDSQNYQVRTAQWATKPGSFSKASVIHYPIFRKFMFHGLFALVGSIFFAIGVYLWNENDAPLIIAIIFCFLGGAAGLAGYYGLSNSLTITLNRNRFDTIKKIFGITVSKHTAHFSEIKEISSKEAYRSKSGGKHSIHYNILALLHNGKKIKLAEAENETSRQIIQDFFSAKVS